MKTKADYEAYGRRMAVAASHELPNMKEGSWQHTAFHKGYQAGKRGLATINDPLAVASREARGKPLYHNALTGVISSRPQVDISKLQVVDTAQLLQDTKWPQATREHARILATQHNGEGYMPRRSRLFRALLRLTMRHNGLRKLTGLRAMAIVPMRSRAALY